MVESALSAAAAPGEPSSSGASDDEERLRTLWALSLPSGTDWRTLSPTSTYKPKTPGDGLGATFSGRGTLDHQGPGATVSVPAPLDSPLDSGALRSAGLGASALVAAPASPAAAPAGAGCESEAGRDTVRPSVRPDTPTTSGWGGAAAAGSRPQAAAAVATGSGPGSGSEPPLDLIIRASDPSGLPGGGAGAGSSPRSAAAGAGGPASAAVANFELLGEIGRGGMGVVYRARQKSLDREVAVKRLLPGRRDAHLRERFLAEAQVTGLLDHPNVVPVHELCAGPDGEVSLAMKLVGGISWRDLLHPTTAAHQQNALRHDLAGHLRILLNVCNAVAFAHSRGIAHRDLKPDNVMVGEFGEVLVMDWGIACDFRDDPKDSRAPHKASMRGPAGTPCYMPPELAEGRNDEIGPPTDVYLLGAILYEVVSGKPPHWGKDILHVLLLAAQSAPPVFGHDVPDELAGICRRALAREPEDRYQTVAAFQEAIRTFLEHRESTRIAEAALGALGRCERSIRESGARLASGGEAKTAAERNRLYADFAEAVAGFRQARLLWAGNQAARSGERRARLTYARAAVEAGDLGLAEAQATHLEIEGEDAEADDLKRTIARRYEERAREERRVRALRRGLGVAAVLVIAVLATGVVMVKLEEGRTKEERDRAVNAERLADDARVAAEAARGRAVESEHQSRLEAARGLYDRSFRYTDEGRPSLAMACLLRALEIAPPGGSPHGHEDRWGDPGWAEEAWLRYRYLDAVRGRRLFTLAGHQDFVRSVAALPFGTKALTAGDDGTVRVWDLVYQLEAGRFAGHRGFVYAVAATPDGRLAASGGRDRVVRVWEVSGTREVHALAGHVGDVRALAISANGKRLASGSDDGTARVWDLASGREVGRFAGHVGAVLAVALSDDGEVGVSGGADGTVRLWDAEQGGEIARMKGHTGWVSSVALAEGGKALASGSFDRTVRTWDPLTGQELKRLDGHEAGVLSVVLTRDGRLAASGGADGTVRIWDTAAGRLIRRIDVEAPDVLSIALTPDELVALTASSNGLVHGWDLQAVRERHRLEGHAVQVGAVAIDARGRFVSGGGDGKLLVWDPVSEEVTWSFVEGGITHLATLTEPGHVLVASYDAARGRGSVAVHDVVLGQPVRVLAETTGRLADVAVAASAEGGGGLALVAPGEGPLRLLRIAEGSEALAVAPPGEVWAAALDASGWTALVGLADGSARVLDLAAGGVERMRLDGHAEEVTAAALSADARIALTGSTDRTVRVWEVASGRELRRLEGHQKLVTEVLLAADGRTALSASADRTARVWDAVTGQEQRRLEGHLSAVEAIAVSPDGLRAVTGSTDATVRIWQLLDPEAPSTPPSPDPTDLEDPLRAFRPFYAATGWRIVPEGPQQGAIVPVKP